MALVLPINPVQFDKTTIDGQVYEYNGIGWIPFIDVTPTKSYASGNDTVLIQDSEDNNEYKLVKVSELDFFIEEW